MKFRVLIIDDEKSIRDIFSLLLEDQGYLVETAGKGKEGIAVSEKWDPEVILLDMNLPDVSGLEVLAEIKKRRPKTEIIIMTAYGTIKNAVEATKLGAYAYLEKPVDNE
jgi:two-component system response regulator AtoC